MLGEIKPISYLVEQGYLNQAKADSLTQSQKRNIAGDIQVLILAGVLDFDVAIDLTYAQYHALVMGPKEQIIDRKIKASDAMEFDEATREAIYRLYDINPEFGPLTPSQIANLSNHDINRLILRGRINANTVANFSEDETKAFLLCHRMIERSRMGEVTWEKVKALTKDQLEVFSSPQVKKLVPRKLAFDVAKDLTADEIKIIEDLYEIIKHGCITLEKAKKLTPEQRKNFLAKGIQSLIKEGFLRILVVKCLCQEQIDNILSGSIPTLIRKGILNEQTATELEKFEVAFLIRDEITARLIDNTLTIEEALKMAKKQEPIEEEARTIVRTPALTRRSAKAREEKEKSEETFKPGAHGGGGSGGGR